MNLPNLLTISRIFLAMVFWLLCLHDTAWEALLSIAVFTLAATTDLLDGWLARKYNLTTSFGKIMDPIADKVLVLTAMFIFASLEILSWWMVILIAAREVLVTASRILLVTEGKVIPAEKAGKLKTALQITTVSVVLVYRFFWIWGRTHEWMKAHDNYLSPTINGFMIATLLVTLWSGGVYFYGLKKDRK